MTLQGNFREDPPPLGEREYSSGILAECNNSSFKEVRKEKKKISYEEKLR